MIGIRQKASNEPVNAASQSDAMKGLTYARMNFCKSRRGHVIQQAPTFSEIRRSGDFLVSAGSCRDCPSVF